MIVASWNVRGFNKQFKHKELPRVIKKENIVVLAITEHQVTKQKAPGIAKKVFPQWSWYGNYGSNEKGRIWIVWDHT
ncbi:hypothetical protein RDI58_004375 [Solanum bulbocastanum]|uniref:Uncharacterized protein n=1 Tax=Solanum bulbocastanum TaxID=147425 RepID=A0AAN8YK24_SOLBU